MVKLMEHITEETKISGAVTGKMITNKWQAKVEKVDFYVAKGYVDAVLTEMGHLNVTYRPVIADEYKEFHPGRTAMIYVNDVLDRSSRTSTSRITT